MEQLRNLSSQITKELDKILPNTVRCVFVLVDSSTKEVCVASDLNDEYALALLEEGADTLKDPEVAFDLNDEEDHKLIN
jgi:hypothetical protein